jgi:hypothetical protein
MHTINQISENNPSLEALIQKNKHRKNLEKIFKAFLEDGLKDHCSLAHIEESQDKMILTLTVNSSSMATRLKYEIPDILKNLQTQPEFKKLQKINYVIYIAEEEYLNEKTSQKRSISLENEKRWKELREKLKQKNCNV